MHFETMILLLFSVLGLIDGVLFALLFRRRRFYFYALAMALLGGAAGAYFLWYAKGYDGLGLWSLYLAYGMTGFMVAEIIALFLLVPLSLLSLVKVLRRAAKLLGALGLLASLGIGVYGAYDGNHREVTEHHDIYVKDLPEALEGYRFAQIRTSVPTSAIRIFRVRWRVRRQKGQRRSFSRGILSMMCAI